MAAPTPRTRCAKTLSPAAAYAPSSASRTVPWPNEENVVKAPQNPCSGYQLHPVRRVGRRADDEPEQGGPDHVDGERPPRQCGGVSALHRLAGDVPERRVDAAADEHPQRGHCGVTGIATPHSSEAAG